MSVLHEEMHERSSLFLVFAFAISIGEVVIFYFLLPQYNVGVKFTDYLGITLRPILVLSFFQTLAFYLLKQYKGSMEDYKFFYLEARNRKRFLVAHSILQSEEADKIIAYGIFSDVIEQTIGKDQTSDLPESTDGLPGNLLELFKDKAKEKLKLNGE